jgi:uncharacterized protein YjiS (DUF1127 family)
MTCNTLTKTAGPGDRAWTGHIAARLRAGWQRFLQRRRQEATVHMLEGLDDRTLSDIGLKRSEIESAVNAKAAVRVQRDVDIGGVVGRG